MRSTCIGSKVGGKGTVPPSHLFARTDVGMRLGLVGFDTQ
jgi:hypothetical protein